MSTMDWKCATRTNPCPACGKPDWCATARSGMLKCNRTTEPPPGFRLLKPKGGGALFVLDDRADQWCSQRRRVRIVRRVSSAPIPDFSAAADRYSAAVSPRDLDLFASSLGMTVGSLQRLRVGRVGSTWTFPMQNAAGKIVGIRLRMLDGSKKCVRGSCQALFIPDGLLGSSPLLLAEGPTDTAAMLDLGFDAVGRPCCTGGTEYLITLLRMRKPSNVVIVADGDEPGQRGASALASDLAVFAPDLRVITPPAPFKDARQWVCGGATREDVMKAVEQSERRTLLVRSRRAG